MANITIPDLPAAIALTGAENIPAVQSGSTVRITTSQIVQLAANDVYLTPINNLPTASSVALTDFIPVAQGATVRKATVLQLQSAAANGSTALRPASPANGLFYLDTTLGIPIWALSTSGTGWINAAGFAV
jgi:hypothetical protein